MFFWGGHNEVLLCQLSPERGGRREGVEERGKERRGREKTGRKKEDYSFTFLVAMGEDLAGPSFSFFGSCKRECVIF